jgi:hypothetical protein
MTNKEIASICIANGIPPLLYKWSFSEEASESLKKKLSPIVIDDIDSFIRGRNVWYINMGDSVLSSRLGVTFFKAAIYSGFTRSRYATIENIAGSQIENWYDSGDVYTSLLNADFLVIDKVRHNMEEFQRKVWNKFVEDRLMLQRSTIFVGMVRHGKQGVFTDRAIELLKDIDASVLTDEGVEPLC